MFSNPNITPIMVGSLFVIVGLYILLREINIRINGICAKAVIVDIIKEHIIGPEDNYWVYYPVFEYYVDGQVHRVKVKTDYGSRRTRCYIGKEFKIIYHSEEHERMIVKNDYTLFPISIISIFLGILVFFLGLR